MATKIDSQFSSVPQSCPTLCDPINCCMPGLCPSPSPEVHSNTRPSSQWCHEPSHPLSSRLPPAHNPSQHQSFFQGVNSSYEVAKVLEFLLCSAIGKASSDNHFAFLHFSLEWFWSLPPVHCYKPLFIVLQVLCPSDHIPWLYSLPLLYNHKGFDLGHTWMA